LGNVLRPRKALLKGKSGEWLKLVAILEGTMKPLWNQFLALKAEGKNKQQQQTVTLTGEQIVSSIRRAPCCCFSLKSSFKSFRCSESMKA
jgi:hypothetical protein